MEKEWQIKIKEIARDLIALGGLPFFILVLVRVYLLNKPMYFAQFVVAGLIFLLIALFLRISFYAGLGLVILIFTNLYYQDMRFGVFSVIAYVLLLAALVYLKKEKKDILLGVIAGGLSSGVAYYLVSLLG
jgi:hypothetical protein